MAPETELIGEILALKKATGAVILAHNYVDGAVQDLADFVGDSLELSIKARELNAPLLLFCGVSFMAETAKVLSFDSTVLLPVPDAGCPMADQVDNAELAAYRAEHPGVKLVAYVNTTAKTKALVDVCCTSANAAKVVSAQGESKLMFLPDGNLGRNVGRQLGRELFFWHGCCPVHDAITPEMVRRAQAEHPGCPVLVHPECRPEVVALADYAVSTGKMLKVVRDDPASGFVVGTECGMLYRLQKENPGKAFYGLTPQPLCPDMKKITLESVRDALKFRRFEVKLEREVADAARGSILRMLELN